MAKRTCRNRLFVSAVTVSSSDAVLVGAVFLACAVEMVEALTIVLAALGAARIDVLWWGKVSTFALMTTFPLFLLTSNPHGAPLATWQEVARSACWVIGIVGLSLSWIVLFAYVRPAMAALRAGRRAREIL